MASLEASLEAPPAEPQGDDDRLDVPGVIDDRLLLGSVQHARDENLLKHLQVGWLLDAENRRKRAERVEAVPLESTVEVARVDLDEGDSMEVFRATVTAANAVLQRARADDKTVFVFCTYGNNESAVVCMAFLMVVERWPLERAYRHVLQKRPASAPRKAYIDKLRTLEREVHGRVTLRSDQVGPSMMDLMLGLSGQARVASDDGDERGSQTTDGGTSTLERASIISNVSVATGLHNGSSLRETMVIAEREEEGEESSGKQHDELGSGSFHHRRKRNREQKPNCVIS